jgi:hypothetical protein
MNKVARANSERGVSTLELTLAMPLVVFAILFLIGMGHALISKQHAVVGGQFAAHYQRVRESAPDAAAAGRAVSAGTETFSLSGGGGETLSFTASATPRKGLIARLYRLNAANSQYQTPNVTNACVPDCRPFDSFARMLSPEMITGIIFSGNSSGFSGDGLLSTVAGTGNRPPRQRPEGAEAVSPLVAGVAPAAGGGGGGRPPGRPPQGAAGAADDDGSGNGGNGNPRPTPRPTASPTPRPSPTPTPRPQTPREPEKPARDLISGSLKRSPSYHSELEGYTQRELEQMARGRGPQAQRARQMLKLIKEGERLRNK